MVVNKREIIHHESTVCEYRKVKCHNCVKIEQDIKEMKEKIEGLASKEDLKSLVVQMFEKLRLPENTLQDILVVGGWHPCSIISDLIIRHPCSIISDQTKFSCTILKQETSLNCRLC